MRIMRVFGVVAAVAVMATWAGCGGSSSSGGGGDGLTENQAIALSEQISGVAVNAMNSSYANASANADLGAAAMKGVVCNEAGCTINIPIDYGQNCTAGGRIAVTGSITGSTSSNGTGVINMQATETITDWQCITGYIINGDPYISLVGTFSFINAAPATRQDMTISGGFKWGTTAEESCQISLSINFGNDGSATISGTVCGYPVSAST